MDLALNRLLKSAKKASSPVARTPGRAGKDGFLENATYLAQGSLYGGIFRVYCNTLSVLLESDNKNNRVIKSHRQLHLDGYLALNYYPLTASKLTGKVY
jgi:hypothetical protein